MSSSRRFLSKPASLHQLSYRRYGKGTWLAPDWQWDFKCQELGFGFVLGSHQKCLSFEVTGSDVCFQEIILEALCCLLKPHSPILSLSSWWFLTQVQEITFVHAHSSLLFSLPLSVSLTTLLRSHTRVHAHTPLIWVGDIICRRLIEAGFLQPLTYDSCDSCLPHYLGSDGTRWRCWETRPPLHKYSGIHTFSQQHDLFQISEALATFVLSHSTSVYWAHAVGQGSCACCYMEVCVLL